MPTRNVPPCFSGRALAPEAETTRTARAVNAALNVAVRMGPILNYGPGPV